MPEELKVGVSVDVGALDNFAGAAEVAAKSTDTLANSTRRLGLEALTGKQRASEWVAEQYRAEAAAMALALQSKHAAEGVTSLERAMAVSGTRIAASTLGVGQLGMAFGRVTGASAALAPIMAAAFPVFAGMALISVAETLYGKLRDLENEALRNSEAWQKIDHSSAAMGESMERSIERADVKITELTEGKLAALELELRQIGDGAVQMAAHMETLFDGIGKQIEKEIPLFDKVKDFMFTVSHFGVVPVNLGEAAKAFGTDLAETLDTEGLEAGIAKVANQIRVVNAELAKTPGDVVLEKYARQLIHILGLLEERQRLEQKEKEVAGLEIGKEGEREAEAAEKSNAAYLRTIADRDLADFNRAREAAEKQERLEEQVSADSLRLAQKDLTEFERIQHEKAEAAIRAQAEIIRESQRGPQLEMERSRASAQLAGAGQPTEVRAILDSGALREQAAIASRALEEMTTKAEAVKEEIARLNAELGATKDPVMVQNMRSELTQLQSQYDTLTDAAERWGNEGVRIAAQQKANFETVGMAAANAAEAGAATFNASFNRMITGGMTFAHVMQQAWTAMAESFINSVLKMTERFVAAEILKLGVSKAANAASTEATLASNLTKRFDDARTAAANTMANVPTPLNFIMAPIVFAATLAFQKGGIVPAALHEGEMVLPAHLSTFVQTAAATASGRGGGTMPGGDASRPITFQYHTHVSTLSGEGMDDVLSAHGDRMFDFMRGKLRRMGQNI